MAASGIRAPLTVDESDFDYSISRSSYSSDESDDGFLGNDEFESACEIPNLSEQEEEPNLISKLELSRPSIVNVNENRNIPDEEFGDDSIVTGSLVRTLDDEVAINVDDDSATGEDVLVSEVIPDVAVKVPIAKISFDSDDDEDDNGSEASVVLEDDGLSDVVRVSTVGILQRVDSAPKARVSVAGDEGNDDEVELHDDDNVNAVNLKFGENMEASDHDSDDENVPDLEFGNEVVTGDHDLGLNHKTRLQLAEGEEHKPELELDMSRDHLDVEVREIDVIISDIRMCADLLYQRDPSVDLGSTSSSDSTTDLGTCAEEAMDVIIKDPEDLIVDIKEVSTDCCPKISDLTEITTETIKEDISDGSILPEDAKLDKETNVADKIGERLLHHQEGMVELFSENGINDEQRSDNLFGTAPLADCGFKDELGKMQTICVKYLRLLHRLGYPDDSIASKVLSMLTLCDQRVSTQQCHLDSAKTAATKHELQNDSLDFSICILVIGKAGVGKSSTINSIFGETKTAVDAFEPATTRVKEISGSVDGVEIKVIDTPGLKTSAGWSVNRKTLLSIKKVMQKSPPDVILYVDRFDTPIDDSNDLLLLNTISSCLGPKMWEKCILVLTHFGSVPPDGPDGSPLGHDAIIARRLLSFQQGTRDKFVTTNLSSVFPVSLVENHPVHVMDGCQRKFQLLLSCYSMKILSEINSGVTVQNAFSIGKMLNSFHRDQRNQTTGRLVRPSSHLLNQLISNQKNNIVYILKAFKNQVFGLKVQDRIIEVGEAAEPYVGADVELSRDSHSSRHGQISLGLSVMKSRHEVVCGCNIRSQFSVGSSWRVRIGAGLDSKLNRQVLIQPRCCEQVQIAVMALLPIARGVLGRVFWRSGEDS